LFIVIFVAVNLQSPGRTAYPGGYLGRAARLQGLRIDLLRCILYSSLHGRRVNYQKSTLHNKKKEKTEGRGKETEDIAIQIELIRSKNPENREAVTALK